TDIIPAAYRKPLYALYALAGLVLGAWQLAVEPDPHWLVTAFVIYGFVGGGIGATAASNTPRPAEQTADGAHVVTDVPPKG
ncbi:MAG TPA: hypothetical protein VFJ19_11855, partial [Nocardioidaceae bacterium]|nr:hypothetical protein [Nocardioidaceae bacterium]